MKIRLSRHILRRGLPMIALFMMMSPGAGAQMMGSGMMGQPMGPGMMQGDDTTAPPRPTAQSTGRAEFAQTCSACHALPDPRMHTASQWPAVVARMRNMMSATGQPIPSQQTFDDIVRYLRSQTVPR